jgi:hypothetical protein
MTRMLSAWAVVMAATLAPEHSAAAKTPSLSIELAKNTPNEKLAKEQLERLANEYDLSRWIFTKKIRIEQGVRPHSHPVLTLNTRTIADDRQTLASFVHEQIHWFLSKKSRETNRALAAVRGLYPDAPDGPATGGAANLQSTYLHLIVCHLELESLQVLLGAEAAAAVIRQTIEFGQTGPGYHWIYQKVLDDQLQLAGLIRQHDLMLPGVSPARAPATGR